MASRHAVRLFFAQNMARTPLSGVRSAPRTEFKKEATMLDDQLKTQLAAYLERVTQPFELVASLDDSDTAREMLQLLQTIQSLRADKISLRTDGSDARRPSFSLQRVGSSSQLRFAGLPLGHEFTSLVLALL